MFSTGMLWNTRILHHITTNTQTQPENFQETLLTSTKFPGFPGGKNYSSRFPGFPGVLDTLRKWLWENEGFKIRVIHRARVKITSVIHISGGGCWKSVGQRRWQTKRYWYVLIKLGAYWKWFGAGSIDGLGMFSGMTTYSMTLSKGKCWARLFGVGKGWSYCMIWWKGEIMDSWKI